MILYFGLRNWNYVVFLMYEFANFADSEICNFDTSYASGKNIGYVAICLEDDMENVLKWVDSNRMVANPDKWL